MPQICRACNNYKQFLNPEGFCKSCMRKEMLKRKISKFGERQQNLNRIVSGGIT